MAEIYNRTLVETKAAMLLIPQSARVLAKNNQRRWQRRVVSAAERAENEGPGESSQPFSFGYEESGADLSVRPVETPAINCAVGLPAPGDSTYSVKSSAVRCYRPLT